MSEWVGEWGVITGEWHILILMDSVVSNLCALASSRSSDLTQSRRDEGVTPAIATT